MANICSFSMCVKGTHKNIESFYNALIQKGTIWMGRGADAEIHYEDNGKAFIDGWCKWSIYSALINNAISMRTEPDLWYHGDEPEVLEFITLEEACAKWCLEMEVYSEEYGCCFQEHYLINNDEVIINDCVEACEYDLYEYETKEEAEAEFKIKLSDEEWDKHKGDRFIVGGFENWDFEI